MVRELFVWGKYVIYNYLRGTTTHFWRNSRQVAGAPPPPQPLSLYLLYLYMYLSGYWSPPPTHACTDHAKHWATVRSLQLCKNNIYPHWLTITLWGLGLKKCFIALYDRSPAVICKKNLDKFIKKQQINVNTVLSNLIVNICKIALKYSFHLPTLYNIYSLIP
jgi:hypothetical protein